MSIFCRFLS